MSLARTGDAGGSSPARTVGIIGGLGPESTIEYYRFLVENYRSRLPAGRDHYPSILINSVDLTRLVAWFESGNLQAATEYLAAEVARLARAGAELAVLSANTPHIVFDGVRARSPVPMISLVEAAGDAAVALGLTRVGLLGTRFTMQGPLYPDVFAPRGVAIVTPEPGEQDDIHALYMGELVKGVFRPETRERLLSIAGRLHQRQRVEAIILGGTELPLLLRDVPDPVVPFLDTTRIHVRSIVTWMLAER